MTPLGVVGWLLLGVVAWVVWWQRPRWLLWLEEPRVSRDEKRRQRLRVATNRARDMVVAGYAREAVWWARRARCIDPHDADALAALAAAHAYRGLYESAVKHWRLALNRAQESGLAAVNAEEWSSEALELATALLILADEDLARRESLRQEAVQWLQFALMNHPDCRVELNPRLQAMAPSEWVMP